MTAHSLAVSAPSRRRACLCAGLLLAVLALALIGGLGGERMFVHATGLLLLADLAPLLLVLGLLRPTVSIGPAAAVPAGRWPEPDRARGARTPAPPRTPAPTQTPPQIPAPPASPFDRLTRLMLTRLARRTLTHPVVALALWALALYAWHLSSLYEAALQHAWVQALQCLTLLVCGLNMWARLLGVGASPAPRWFGERARVAGILTSRLLAAILANVLLWSGAIFYSYYARGDALTGLSPLADQNIAGAIMLTQEALLTLGLLCWLAIRVSPPASPPKKKTAAQPRMTRSRSAARSGMRGTEPATGAYGHGEAVL